MIHKMRAAGELLELPVLDHIIITSEEYYSFPNAQTFEIFYNLFDFTKIKVKFRLFDCPNLEKMKMGADYELWNGIIRGDKSSFAVVFKTYYEVLFNYALRFTHDEDRAKDFIQELFMNIWRNRSNLSEVRFVKSYLIKSLRRTILRELKRNNLQETFNESLLNEVDKKFFHNFQLATDGNDFQTEKLKELLSELSFQQKEVLYLRYYNDLDFKEIAQIMSLSYQSVRNYAHQAIVKLRKYLLMKNI